MGKNILPHVSLPVNFNLPVEYDLTYKVIVLSMAVYAMQWRLWSSGYHTKKPYKVQCCQEVLILVAGFCAFFLCFDSQNDLFTWLAPHELCRFLNNRTSGGKHG